MKYILFICSFAIFFNDSSAQSNDILGIWLSEKKDAKVEVYKKNNFFFGKIIWLKNDRVVNGVSNRIDTNNPDQALQNRRILGIDVLSNLVWDEDDNEWDDGDIYDPRNGKTYSVYAKLEDPNTLYIRGYIGLSLIGRSTLWTRVK